MIPLLKALFSLSLQGYMLSNGSQGVIVRTTAACADRCLADMSCYGFFFNKKTGLCQSNNSPLVNTGILAPSSDMRYYVFNTGSCPIQKGYRLSMDPPVCYRVGVDVTNHDHAMAICQADGGFLIRIDSQRKQEFVAQLHKEMPSSAEPWVDGSDRLIEDEWRFADGTVMTYSSWYVDSTSVYTQPDHDGDCLRVRGGSSKWFDTNCGLYHLYICEMATL